MKYTIIMFFIINCSVAYAGYERVGQMKATICSGVVIKSCQQKEIVAIEQNGSMYEPSNYFNSVTSFKGRNCTINTSSNNVITSAAQKMSLPIFYTLESGRLLKINPDYVSFKCVKR